MNAVTVIGLGAMGSALATAFLNKGRRVTIWNRTEKKAERFAAKGATVAKTPADAFAASGVTVVCVDNYAVLLELLKTEGCAKSIEGKTVIQLSTGTPHDARNAEGILHAHRANYLDGAILAYPEGIGADETAILVSGEEAVFLQCESLLRDLAGGTTFVGSNVGNAAALDSAALSAVLGLYAGFLHGVAICEKENLPVLEFGQMIAEKMPIAAAGVLQLGERIASASFNETQASLKTYAEVARRLLIHAETSRINASFPEYASKILALGESKGLGEQDLAALIAVFREKHL